MFILCVALDAIARETEGMKMKHFYVLTSNFDIATELAKEESFRHPGEYSPQDYSKLHRNEYGMLQTLLNSYHFLLGGVPQETCPWCGGAPELIRITPEPDCIYKPMKMFFKCEKCGSQGPVLYVNEYIENKTVKIYEDLCKRRYECRMQWDYKFVNPYDTA